MARGVLCSLLAVGSVVSAHAQTDNQVYSSVSFNLSSPGARSLALAGAFTGLADDATAAYANPAGLTQLPKPQLSIEARYSSTDTPYTKGGTFLSTPATPFPQPFNGVIVGNDRDTSIRPSFISMMIPHGNWGLGIFRHELANTTFNVVRDSVRTAALITAPTTESLTLKIVDWGIAGSYKLNDNISLGASLSYFQNHLESSLLAGTLTSTKDSGSSSAIAGNVGVLVKHGKASFGAVYHRSPDFSFSTTSRVGVAAPQTKSVDFKAPDAYGVGFAYRLMEDTLVYSADLQQVKYSDLTNPANFTVVFGTGGGDTPADFHANDATQVRMGLEKSFFRATNPSTFAVRVGGWYEPAHGTTYSGKNPFRGAYFLPAKPLTHLTGGVGFVLGDFQADLGADVSSRSKVVAVSFVKPFKFSR
jgi:long-subunit fatty acid transport protein